MPLPKSVKVAGIPYVIKEHESLTRGTIWPDTERDKEDILWGACDTGQQLIHLDSKQAQDTKKITLVHELIHAMLDQTTYASNMEQENICGALATLFYNFIRDNPRLIEYLKEKK